MQSRYSVAGIQYLGGLMSAHKNHFTACTQNFARNDPINFLIFVMWTLLLRCEMGVSGCHRLKCQHFVPSPCEMLEDVNAVRNQLRHILPTQAQLMHPICPLWAPIHQAKREVQKRRDNLLLKCLKGEGDVGALRRFYSVVLNFVLGWWSQCCYETYS